jgi:hypothetical protein
MAASRDRALILSFSQGEKEHLPADVPLPGPLSPWERARVRA